MYFFLGVGCWHQEIGFFRAIFLNDRFCYMGPGTAIRGRKEDRRGRSTFVVHDTSVVVLLEDHWRPMVVP